MWIRLIPLLFFALIIDGFQFLVSLALVGVMAFPGTVGGCAAGSYIAGELGCLVLGAIGTIPVINGALATVAEPIGIGLGFAISICISFTFGSMLVFGTVLTRVFDGKAASMAYLGEVAPGFSLLPAWTAYVVRCGFIAAKKEVVAQAAAKVSVNNRDTMGEYAEVA